MFLFGGKKLLAIDIGSSTIKLAEIEHGRKKPQLVNFSMVPTPSGCVNGGEITDPQTLSEAIRSLISQAKCKRKVTSVAIWGSAVIVKRISVGRMEESVLAEQIKFEAEQYIPFDINSVNVDYSILKNKVGTPETMNLLLIAAQRETVMRYAETIELAGLELGVIDVEGFALSNCFKINHGDMSGEVVAVLNFGAATTNFVVMEDGEVIFSRDISIGGFNYSSDISKALGVSIEEAESLKISTSTNQAAPQEVIDLINSTNEVVAEEIHRSFDFFAATVPDTPIRRVFATGGSFATPNLASAVSKTIGLEVERFDPLAEFDVSTKVLTPEYIARLGPLSAIALGLAWRKMDDR